MLSTQTYLPSPRQHIFILVFIRLLLLFKGETYACYLSCQGNMEDTASHLGPFTELMNFPWRVNELGKYLFEMQSTLIEIS